MARVLYVDMALALGGSVVSLYRLLAGMDRRAIEPLVCLYHDNGYADRFRQLGIETLTLHASDRPAPSVAGWVRKSGRSKSWRRRLGDVRRLVTFVLPMAWRLRRLMRRQGVALVHANNALADNREAILAARWAQVPCLVHVRRFQRVEPLDRRLARGLAGTIYIARAVADDYRRQGVQPPRDWVVYDGLPPDAFAPVDAGVRASVRQEFGLADDVPLVGLVGRLTPWKGQDVFLRAFAQVGQAMPQARALLVGEGGPGDEAFVAQLHRLADELHLREAVRFVGARQDVQRLLRGLDVLAHSSTEPEPFGLVLIEGMAVGLPVVATQAGGAVEAVDDGRTGYLVPMSDAAAMAEALLALLRDPAQAMAMGRLGRRVAEARFTQTRFVAAVLDVYRQIGVVGV